jgi:predicted dienelactone hydrolase
MVARSMRAFAIVVALIGLAACSDSAPNSAPDSVEHPGPHAAATTRFTITDTSRSRTLTVQAWYPTTHSPADTPIEMLEADPIRTQYSGLLATAPSCPSRSVHVALDAAPAAGTFPVVLFSHCASCTRLSNATTAERLATHGFLVLAVDHADDTLWDHLAGHDANLDTAFLKIRAGDVRFVLDQLVAGATPVSASADLKHVGMFGHSFGAVTAGLVAQMDDRIASAAALCAPIQNPLTPGVTVADIRKPLMFVVAEEDNSITELGNVLLRSNYRNAPAAAWKLEIPDAGHWSVSDLDGLVDIFKAGCGDATRQTDGTDFTYLDPPTGRAIAAAYVTAFFKATLLGDEGARVYLSAKNPTFWLQAESHD